MKVKNTFGGSVATLPGQYTVTVVRYPDPPTAGSRQWSGVMEYVGQRIATLGPDGYAAMVRRIRAEYPRDAGYEIEIDANPPWRDHVATI